MKLNIAYPAAGTQQQLNITDEHKLRTFFEKRISHEVLADPLGPEWKGYLLKITGGADKCGTPMMQGVLTTGRVSLLLGKGQIGCKVKRQGVRYRRSVRGCIVDSTLSVLNLIVVKKGVQEIPGLTDVTVPRRLGPKRADKIRKIFKLSDDDDVRRYVIRRKAIYKDEAKRKAAEESKKPEMRKAPKIQRLITLKTKSRRKDLLQQKQKRTELSKKAADDYHQLLYSLKHKAKLDFEEHRRRKHLSISASVSEKAGDSVVASSTKSAKVTKPVVAATKKSDSAVKKSESVPSKKTSLPIKKTIASTKKATVPGKKVDPAAIKKTAKTAETSKTVVAPKKTATVAAPSKKVEVAPKIKAKVAAAPAKKTEATPKKSAAAPSKKVDAAPKKAATVPAPSKKAEPAAVKAKKPVATETKPASSKPSTASTASKGEKKTSKK